MNDDKKSAAVAPHTAPALIRSRRQRHVVIDQIEREKDTAQQKADAVSDEPLVEGPRDQRDTRARENEHAGHLVNRTTWAPPKHDIHQRYIICDHEYMGL